VKQIFGVLVTRNESDIVESFFRYNLTYLDGILVYENYRSIDNTRSIIQNLINEELPIYFTDYLANNYGNNLYELANAMAKIAVDKYGADLIVRLDTDEFLYHIDGINPRETLEALREDVEYQIPWRTYVYEKEPDIKLGFMPNNFTHYRNPALEVAQGHAGTTLSSKYLIKEKKAEFGAGAHWLQYPEEYYGSVQIENPEKLVCAHFPIISNSQILKRTIPNWLSICHRFHCIPDSLLNGKHQLAILFNELKQNGEITPDKMKLYSLEYSVRNSKNNLSAGELIKIKNELGESLIINGPMDVSFCADKLKLRYTDYSDDNKIFLRATSNEIYSTVSFFSSEYDIKLRQLNELGQERNGLVMERDRLLVERDGLVAERDDLLNSRSWRVTKPMRELAAFIRRNKVLYLFAKGIISLKRNGIKGTVTNYKQWQLRKQLPPFITDNLFSLSEKLTQESTIFQKKIKISIITPLYNTPEQFLREMIDSVKRQTYSNWELCLADGSDEEHKSVMVICKDYARKDKRIKYKNLGENFGISGNSNKAMEMSSGDYLGLLDHDDVLHPAALYEVMKAICNKGADFIYTDEATFTNDNIILRKHHKPDYAIDTLLSCNYICHFSVFSRKLVDQAGTFRSEFDGSQDHDLILRYTDIASKIVHISKLLYFWRSHENSAAFDLNTKLYAITAGRSAVKEYLAKHGIPVRVESTKVHPTIYRVIYDLIERPLVSIIIPNKDNISLLRNCLSSIMEKTTYDNYEIIIVENNSTEDVTFTYYEELKQYANIRVVYWKGKGFYYSELNNFALQYVKGTQLIFLNNDVEIITPNWIEEMLMYSQRSDVGAVGIKLYFSDNTIQHAGIILGIGGIADYILPRAPRDTIGYMGKLHFVQNMSAVTAACMMVRMSVFKEVGQFPLEFTASFNDVDLCMRIRKSGYLIVWTPFAEAYHYESKTRGYPDTPEKLAVFAQEIALFKEKWAKELAVGDPYYNCNFSLDSADYSLK